MSICYTIFYKTTIAHINLFTLKTANGHILSMGEWPLGAVASVNRETGLVNRAVKIQYCKHFGLTVWDL